MKLEPDELSRLAYVISSQFVERPDLLRIKARKSPNGTYVVEFPGNHLKIDHSRLIGGGGKHYHALKCLLQEAVKGQRLVLDITEPAGERMAPTPMEPNASMEKDEAFRAVLESVAEDVFDYPVDVRMRSTPHGATFTLELGEIDPELLSAFQVLWKAIGRHHGRNFILNAEAPKEQAV